MSKQARPEHPIHQLIAARWSPYGYQPKGVSREDLQAVLEAARWAASSFNEQPWRFLVARREDDAAFQKTLGCLMDANQAWAQHAGVLILTAVSTRFSRNDKPNLAAEHDLGLAVGNLTLEATARGLHVHQMMGVHHDAVREAFAIPEPFKPMTAIAVGHAAAPEDLDESLRGRDTAPRERKPLAEIAFGTTWGEQAELS